VLNRDLISQEKSYLFEASAGRQQDYAATQRREYESWCLLIIYGDNKYNDFINLVFFSKRSFAFSSCPCADLRMMTYL
jgi:hypothetical protein